MRAPLGGRGALLADLGVGMGAALVGRPRRARIDALGLRRFPAAGALVDLDCVNRVGYVRGRGIARLDDLLTYSGGAGGTVVGRDGLIAAAAALRFDHDPRSYERLGLLAEEQRTNFYTQSGDFSSAAWNKNNCTYTGGGWTAPDGTTAGMLVPNVGVAGYIVQSPAYSYVAGTTYTDSVHVKPGGRAEIYLLAQLGLFSDGIARTYKFTLTGAGTATATSGSGHSATITPVGNGAYRITLTFTPDVSIASSVQLRDGVFGDGVNGVYAWGRQLEAGSFATSYIPTTSAAVTRTADSATLSLAGIWRDDLPVVLYSEADAVDLSTSRVALCVNDGTAANRHQTGHAPVPFGVVSTGGVQVLNATAAGAVAAARVASRACLSVTTDDGRVAGNGVLSTRDTSLAMPSGITTLRLGGITATNGTLGGHVRRAIVWQPGMRFPDALIQERTQP